MYYLAVSLLVISGFGSGGESGPSIVKFSIDLMSNSSIISGHPLMIIAKISYFVKELQNDDFCNSVIILHLLSCNLLQRTLISQSTLSPCYTVHTCKAE